MANVGLIKSLSTFGRDPSRFCHGAFGHRFVRTGRKNGDFPWHRRDSTLTDHVKVVIGADIHKRTDPVVLGADLRAQFRPSTGAGNDEKSIEDDEFEYP